MSDWAGENENDDLPPRVFTAGLERGLDAPKQASLNRAKEILLRIITTLTMGRGALPDTHFQICSDAFEIYCLVDDLIRTDKLTYYMDRRRVFTAALATLRDNLKAIALPRDN